MSTPIVVVTDEATHVDAVRVPDVVITAFGMTYLPGTGAGPTMQQLVAASDFTFHHNLAYPPPVRFVDPTGLDVAAGIEYPTPSQVHVEFPTPFTGTVLIG